uniref:C-type lectin domain-containing protein n=1 Tax=Caenorhabditis tropicalis TaxID=1561998 RepID=A0A1I7TVR8_9PELO
MLSLNKDAPPPYSEREEIETPAVEVSEPDPVIEPPRGFIIRIPCQKRTIVFILVILIIVISISVFLILFLNKPPSCDYRVGKKCLTVYNVSMGHDDAYSMCNGKLITAKKYSEDIDINIFLSEMKIDNVWLGMKCHGGTVSSCVWDNKKPLDYDSFSPGFPEASSGQCVVYRMSDDDRGRWISWRCEWMARVLCEY